MQLKSQQSFSSLAYQEKKKRTRREAFLDEMDQVMPWSVLEKIIAPSYPKAGNGRRPMNLSLMLRIYCMQQWFNLSDPSMEDALYDSRSMQQFAGIEVGEDAVPDETTILNFRHLLEEHNLTPRIFGAISKYLRKKGLAVREGTITDATIIHAPSSTKNQSGKRDPEMSSTKKGNQWYFGMKAHVGVDTHSGLAHTVTCTNAKVHDSQEMEKLLHGEEQAVYGDKAYSNEGKRAEFEDSGVSWKVAKKAPRGQKLSAAEEEANRRHNKVRSKVEHVFGVVKNLWGYRRVRYRGIYKNHCQIESLLALANIYMVRKQLLQAASGG